MKMSISASSFVESINEHILLCSDSDALDLLTCESFKDYLWWMSRRGYLKVHTRKDAEPWTAKPDVNYWRVSDLHRLVKSHYWVDLFAADRGYGASRFYEDWAYHLLRKDTVGVFSEFKAFQRDWSALRFKRNCSKGQLFLELVFSYKYTRTSLGGEPGTVIGEISYADDQCRPLPLTP